ncbi:CvfB family protein [Aerococcus sanguinicola]|uniref:CvfB family protein n=1 Tax=unclassified Aerococcus TaxID=2618060 RepID=UPI0008A579E9|nr:MULTISPECIES: S1-like domain-containing RNA-binding protein [unclassified Aerococcus]KAB0647791.1 DNA-binding protein [Aerococcus sanguinicola]MDK6232966.1 S1-like domain-containing RNA-binding protein [Aerococcus sp. UMB10185]MDK6855260.1 S1-like domain-containing RNA-binding protein [Aerococcus sp. UMB7533]MDK8502091.1 S1-like domain-containing RNA-binding protein [Aerococcus sp. UMB1112A]OFN05254.1 DNA-binding protein [Aerococcus sp. HMSC062A02]
MNKYLGSLVTGIVTDENDKHFFVQKDGLSYRLDRDQAGSLKMGDSIRGFVYENSHKQLCMTLDLPDVRQDRYGWGEVTSVKQDLGVFLAIGLPDKDMVLSLDDLPQEKHLWPKKGSKLFVRLEVDKKDRVWAKLADDQVFQQISKRLSPHTSTWNNKTVKARVYRCKFVGTYLLTEDYYQAFIHESERYEEPALGEEVTARVIGVGQHGNLNLSLKPQAYQVINEDAQMIQAILERQPDHFLPYNDKSRPEDIRKFFNLSKAQFKRALGHLMKEGILRQDQAGIYLVNKGDED